MSKLMGRFGMVFMFILLMAATVACAGDKKATAPAPAQTTAVAKATATPAPDKVGMLLEQGEFKEAITETYGIQNLSERDKALKRVTDAAIKFEDFEQAHNAAWRIRESQLKDQGLEAVVAAALTRDKFETASEAAQYIPGKRGQELLSQVMRAATERGKFYDAMSAAGKLENPNQRDAAVKELMDTATAQGYSPEQIYWYSSSSAGTRDIVLRLIKQKNPTWTIPQGR